MYNHQIKSYDAQLKKQRELLDDASIYARKSGYVTYVKDVSKGNTVRNSENVVIVSDYNDAYIELGYTIDERLLERYTSCYTIINGKKYSLNEYEYSSNEKLVADSRNIYPSVRLRFEDPNMKLDVGKSVAVLLKKDFAEEVRKHFKEKVFDVEIPRNVRLSEAPSHGKPIGDYDPDSRAAKAYENLAKEVISRNGQ